jgi:hypothetical protein
MKRARVATPRHAVRCGLSKQADAAFRTGVVAARGRRRGRRLWYPRSVPCSLAKVRSGAAEPRSRGILAPSTLVRSEARGAVILTDGERAASQLLLKTPATSGASHARMDGIRNVQARLASGTRKLFGASAAFANTCHACHTLVKARDSVYTSYAQR